MKKASPLLLIFSVCVGCAPDGCVARRSQNWNDYKATVRSARTVLPIAVQMEELFPVADHFITHFGFDSGPKMWNTEVFFGGRYKLTIQVDVEIDYKANKVTKVVGEPTFYLNEIEKIQILPDGRALTWYNSRNYKSFGSKEWEKIFQEKGDLSALGLTANPEAVQHFDEYVSQVRRDRIRVSLLDR